MLHCFDFALLRCVSRCIFNRSSGKPYSNTQRELIKMKYKNITYAWAVKKYGTEANKLMLFMPHRLTKDAYKTYFKMCIEGLAGLDGRIVITTKEVT